MPIEPSDVELIRRAIEARLADVHTSGPGKIVSYDAAKQTAEVQPMWTRLTPSDKDGVLEAENYPTLKNVAILFPRSKKFVFDFDLEAGDTVLLICPERNPAEWRETGLQSAPGDSRLHPLAGSVGLPGYYPNASPMTAIGAKPQVGGQLRLHFGDTALSVGEGAVPVALAPLVLSILTQLKGFIAAAAATEAGAAGLGGMTALASLLAAWPGPAPQATSLKATP